MHLMNRCFTALACAATLLGWAATPTWGAPHGHPSAQLCTAHPGTPPHSAQATPKPKANATYTCDMHPEVRQTGPGKCPKCKMRLVPAKPSPRPRR